MTHAHEYFDHELDWEHCVIHHYSNNNGVLLRYEKHPHNDCLFFIEGIEIGVTPDTPFEIVAANVEPLFKAFLNVRNAAFMRGQELGGHEARIAIKKALGIGK